MEITAGSRAIRGDFPTAALTSRTVWYWMHKSVVSPWAGRHRQKVLFYPPDVAQLGIDLAALVVVRVPKPDAIARPGEKLLRSGGLGLVVLDLGLADMPTPLQSRLTG